MVVKSGHVCKQYMGEGIYKFRPSTCQHFYFPIYSLSDFNNVPFLAASEHSNAHEADDSDPSEMDNTCRVKSQILSQIT